MNEAYQVKTMVSALNFAEHHGMDVNRHGFCRCLFHADSRASMKVYPGQKGFYCFTCHAGGSVIDLACQFYGCDFPAAIRFIDSDFNLGLGFGMPRDSWSVFRGEVEAASHRVDSDYNEAEKQFLNTDYFYCYDVWAANEQKYLASAPKSPDDEWTDEFCRRAQQRAILFDDLMRAEHRRKSFYERGCKAEWKEVE